MIITKEHLLQYNIEKVIEKIEEDYNDKTIGSSPETLCNWIRNHESEFAYLHMINMILDNFDFNEFNSKK